MRQRFDIADRSTAVGVATGPINFTVGDIESAAASLTVSGTSSHQGLVPNGNIVFGGSGSNRTVSITPVSGQTGNATITVTVSDGAATSTDTFVLTASAPPTIGPIPDQVVLVDQPTIIKLDVADAETAVTNLQLSLVTSDPNLIRPEDYIFDISLWMVIAILTMAGAFGQTGTATNIWSSVTDKQCKHEFRDYGKTAASRGCQVRQYKFHCHSGYWSSFAVSIRNQCFWNGRHDHQPEPDH